MAFAGRTSHNHLPKLQIVYILLFLTPLVFADMSKTALIPDARSELQTWFTNSVYCVGRHVVAGGELSVVWSGDLAFLYAEHEVQKRLTYYVDSKKIRTCTEEDLKQYECFDIIDGHPKTRECSADEIKAFECFDNIKVEKTYNVSSWERFDSKKASVDLTALSAKLTPDVSAVLSTAKAADVGLNNENIRFCFRTPKTPNTAHISYIGIKGTTYDACQSTLVNITNQSVKFWTPTEANNTYLLRSYTPINISISTDHLDTFKFDWNGSNYSVYDNSLLLAYNFDNNSAHGENSSFFYDISKYGNNASCTVLCPSAVSGKNNGGMFFNGLSNVVNTSNSTSLSSNNYTISAWINVSSYPLYEKWIASKGFYNIDYKLSILPNGSVCFTSQNYSENLSRIAGITLSSCANPQTITIDHSNVFAYVGPFSAGSNITRINLSSFTPQGSIKIANGKIYSSFIDLFDQFGYFATYESPAHIFRMNLSSFTILDNITCDPFENNIVVAVADYINNVGYFVASYSSAPNIIKVNLTTFTRIANLSLSSTLGTPGGGAIDIDSKYMYIATITSPAKVIRIDLSTFSYVDNISLNTGENGAGAVSLDKKNIYGYVATTQNPAKIVKFDLKTFTRLENFTLISGEGAGYSSIIDPSDTFLYVGLDKSAAEIIKIYLSNFTRAGNITLSSGEAGPYSVALTNDGSVLYVNSYNNPGKFTKVRLVDLSTDSVCTSVIPLNLPFFVTGVKNSSGISIFLNGSLQQSKTLTTSYTPNFEEVYVGGKVFPSTSGREGGFSFLSFNGTIDDLFIYNRSFSPAEILSQYNSVFTKYNTTEYRFFINETPLSLGTYGYYGWANDSFGNTALTDNGSVRYYINGEIPTTTTTSTSTTTTSTSAGSTTSTTLGCCAVSIRSSSGVAVSNAYAEIRNISSGVLLGSNYSDAGGIVYWDMNCEDLNWSIVYPSSAYASVLGNLSVTSEVHINDYVTARVQIRNTLGEMLEGQDASVSVYDLNGSLIHDFRTLCQSKPEIVCQGSVCNYASISDCEFSDSQGWYYFKGKVLEADGFDYGANYTLRIVANGQMAESNFTTVLEKQISTSKLEAFTNQYGGMIVLGFIGLGAFMFLLIVFVSLLSWAWHKGRKKK